MSAYTQTEKRYRRASLLAGSVIVLFWAVMAVFLIRERVREYVSENTIDYSLLFKEERIRTFSYMDIYLDAKLLGFTKTNISETEEGGRIIHGETVLDISVIPDGFSMKSVIRISPEKELDQFTFTVKSPFAAQIIGTRKNGSLVIECDEMNYREVMDLPRGIISSGISPFSDVLSLKKGKEWEVGTFDPVSGTVKKVMISVVSEERIERDGREESVYVLECRDSRGRQRATALVDGYGNILRETVDLFGLTLRFERRD